ncbi:unnamed protein product [Orchesella dallaii]|uniref:F-box domain-containing protein n=1 Tax=Orchesella dallaii TaxID=48710 RepID=A0ABP1PLP6_9HEXA
MNFEASKRENENTLWMSKAGGRNIDDFPNEIIAIMLSKLDVKSFLQARGVSKRWRNVTNIIVYQSKDSPIKNYEVKLRDSYDIDWYMESIDKFGDSLGSPFPSGAACILGFGSKYFSTENHPYNQTQLVAIHDRFLTVCGMYIEHLSIEKMKISEKNLLTILTSTANLKSLKVEGSWIDGKPLTENYWTMIRMNVLQELKIGVQILIAHHRGSSKSNTMVKWKASEKNFVQCVNRILSKCNGKKLVVLNVNEVDIVSDVFLEKKAGGSPTTFRSLEEEKQNPQNSVQNSSFYSKFINMQTLSLDVGSQLSVTTTLCSLPYSCLQELSINYVSGTITPHHLSQFAKFCGSLRLLTINFQRCDNQIPFQESSFMNFRLQLDKLQTLRMFYFWGHLDFVVSFHKTLETLELNYLEQKIQTRFSNCQNLFDTLPKLHKLTVGACTLYRQRV